MGKVHFQVGKLSFDLIIFEDVYSPLEDTILIAKHIPENLNGKKVLEIGVGCGILSIIAAIRGGDVTGVDISEDALKNTKLNAEKYNVDIKLIESDLFSNIKGKFDLIIFNPPYVPSDKNDKYLSKGIRYAVSGGLYGTDIIERFLASFKKHLNKNGKVLLIISSHNNIKQKMEKQGWRKIDSANFFFEKIYLMEYIYNSAK
ncbi:MAG: methyltransferase [Candidatus Aenigmarchaeota archaeon]|nr:methyltransferase [Candidatus Aenigmarchaeota archaeon]